MSSFSVLCFDEIKSCSINFKRENQLPVQASCTPKMQHYAHFAKKNLSNDDNPSDSKLKLRKGKQHWKLDFTKLETGHQNLRLG